MAPSHSQSTHENQVRGSSYRMKTSCEFDANSGADDPFMSRVADTAILSATRHQQKTGDSTVYENIVDNRSQEDRISFAFGRGLFHGNKAGNELPPTLLDSSQCWTSPSAALLLLCLGVGLLLLVFAILWSHLFASGDSELYTWFCALGGRRFPLKHKSKRRLEQVRLLHGAYFTRLTLPPFRQIVPKHVAVIMDGNRRFGLKVHADPLQVCCALR